MSAIESIVEELKTLPPHRVELAAHFVHQLKGGMSCSRLEILEQIGGSLTAEEVDEFERIIEAGCENVDE